MSTCTFFFFIVDSINLKPETLYLSIYPVLNNAEDWASVVLRTTCLRADRAGRRDLETTGFKGLVG